MSMTMRPPQPKQRPRPRGPVPPPGWIPPAPPAAPAAVNVPPPMNLIPRNPLPPLVALDLWGACSQNPQLAGLMTFGFDFKTKFWVLFYVLAIELMLGKPQDMLNTEDRSLGGCWYSQQLAKTGDGLAAGPSSEVHADVLEANQVQRLRRPLAQIFHKLFNL